MRVWTTSCAPSSCDFSSTRRKKPPPKANIGWFVSPSATMLALKVPTPFAIASSWRLPLAQQLVVDAGAFQHRLGGRGNRRAREHAPPAHAGRERKPCRGARRLAEPRRPPLRIGHLQRARGGNARLLQPDGSRLTRGLERLRHVGVGPARRGGHGLRDGARKPRRKALVDAVREARERFQRGRHLPGDGDGLLEAGQRRGLLLTNQCARGHARERVRNDECLTSRPRADLRDVPNVGPAGDRDGPARALDGGLVGEPEPIGGGLLGRERDVCCPLAGPHADAWGILRVDALDEAIGMGGPFELGREMPLRIGLHAGLERGAVVGTGAGDSSGSGASANRSDTWAYQRWNCGSSEASHHPRGRSVGRLMSVVRLVAGTPACNGTRGMPPSGGAACVVSHSANRRSASANGSIVGGAGVCVCAVSHSARRRSASANGSATCGGTESRDSRRGDGRRRPCPSRPSPAGVVPARLASGGRRLPAASPSAAEAVPRAAQACPVA